MTNRPVDPDAKSKACASSTLNFAKASESQTRRANGQDNPRNQPKQQRYARSQSGHSKSLLIAASRLPSPRLASHRGNRADTRAQRPASLHPPGRGLAMRSRRQKVASRCGMCCCSGRLASWVDNAQQQLPHGRRQAVGGTGIEDLRPIGIAREIFQANDQTTPPEDRASENEALLPFARSALRG